MGLLDKSTSVAEDPGPWSLLIYGDYGAGKTVLACQAEGSALLDCENGRRALLNHPELISTPIFKINSLAEIKQFAIDLGRDKDENLKTVVVDTVSSLQFYDMNSIMKKLPSDRDKDLPSQAEFNRNNRRISRFCQELLNSAKNTDRNVIFLCHIKEEKDNEGLTTLIRPGTSPALTQAIAPMVDSVFYLSHIADSKGEVKRTLYTISTKKIKGKNRFGNLPTEILNPHFSVIEKAANEQRQHALNLLNSQTNQTNEN